MDINVLILISAVILLAACMAAAYIGWKKKLQKERSRRRQAAKMRQPGPGGTVAEEANDTNQIEPTLLPQSYHLSANPE